MADLLDDRRAAGARLVVATSTPWSKLEGLDARLVRRLAEGTTVQLSLPAPTRDTPLLRAVCTGSTPRFPPGGGRRAPTRTSHDGVTTPRALPAAAFQEATRFALSPRDALLLIGAPVPPVPPRTASAAPPPSPARSSWEFLGCVGEPHGTGGPLAARLGGRCCAGAARACAPRRLEALLTDESPSRSERCSRGTRPTRGRILAPRGQGGAAGSDLAGAECSADPRSSGGRHAPSSRKRARVPRADRPATRTIAGRISSDGVPSMRLPMMAARDILAEPGTAITRRSWVVGASGTGKNHFLLRWAKP